jgi:hypothetical protein
MTKRATLPIILATAVALCCEAGTARSQQVINVPQDYPSIQDAVDAAADGDTIVIGPGTYDGVLITGKHVKIIGSGQGTLIVRYQRKVPQWAGDAMTILGSLASGTEIRGLVIDISEDAIPSDYVPVGIDIYRANDVTVRDVEVRNTTYMGIIAFHASNVQITHNAVNGFPREFQEGAPPAGILLYAASASQVEFNKVQSQATDVCAYGIVLTGFGAYPAVGNQVVHNEVGVTTGADGVIATYAFALFDEYGPNNRDPPFKVMNNVIAFNDFRRSGPNQIAVDPPALADCAVNPDCNILSRNLGDNRRYGPLPNGLKLSIFKP